ncbi:MAG: UvrD-helicase domain-containing protein, partial [Patescibacteria group bacterium]
MINKDKLLSNLNLPQAEAVVATRGPLLVLAGAGSGKTKTLVHRLAYLIAHEKVDPREILAVTFTNKAAQEMKARVGALLGKPIDKNGPLVGTFHAVSCRFLRQEAKHLNYPPHFTIYDEGDQKSLVKEALREIGLSIKQIQPGAILNAISRAKSDLMSPQDYARDVADDFFTENVARIYERYQALLVKNKAFDFDDLIGQMVRVWQENPEVLKKYQTNFKYLLVDEYQDVNQAQYIWTSLLATNHHNLCVVGDDWQSIYGWRGANSANILRFKEDYPEAQVIKLEQNYRSTKIIVAAGNTIMKGASVKADKTLWTNNKEGEPIKIIQVEDETVEARFVVEEIIKLTEIQNSNPPSANWSEADKVQRVEFLPAVETLVEYEDKINSREFLPDYMKIKK